MAFGILVPAGLHAGPATMTNTIRIMPTGIAVVIERTVLPVKPEIIANFTTSVAEKFSKCKWVSLLRKFMAV
jgi:hypothetical protein